MDRSSNRRVHRRNSKYSPGVDRVVRGDENVSRSSPALSNDEEKRERERNSLILWGKFANEENYPKESHWTDSCKREAVNWRRGGDRKKSKSAGEI